MRTKSFSLLILTGFLLSCGFVHGQDAGFTAVQFIDTPTQPASEVSLSDQVATIDSVVVENANLSGSCDWDCGCCCAGPSWTVRTGVLILDRSTGRPRTILTQGGNPALDVTDHKHDFEAGPQFDLIYHRPCGYDIQVKYFGIDAWEATTQVAGNFGLPGAPGNFVVTERGENYGSELFSAEVNFRHNIDCCTTLFAGFRWLELNEGVNINLVSNTGTAPFPGTIAIRTRNDLYGFQIGADRYLWHHPCSPLSLQTTMKAGIYHNNGGHSVSLNVGGPAVPSGSFLRGETTSFVGEIGFRADYQLTCGLSAYGGFQLMWIEDVALAPNQVHFPNIISPRVDFDYGLFYHGAFAGLQFVF